MSVSGHRSESSLKSYTKTGDLTNSKMADCLPSAIDSSEHHVAEIRNTTLLFLRSRFNANKRIKLILLGWVILLELY